MADDAPGPRSTSSGLWWRRLMWLVVLWLSGVLAMGAIAYGLRWAMGWAGLRL